MTPNCTTCPYFLSFQAEYEDPMESSEQGTCHNEDSPLFGNEGAGIDGICSEYDGDERDTENIIARTISPSGAPENLRPMMPDIDSIFHQVEKMITDSLTPATDGWVFSYAPENILVPPDKTIVGRITERLPNGNEFITRDIHVGDREPLPEYARLAQRFTATVGKLFYDALNPDPSRAPASTLGSEGGTDD